MSLRCIVIDKELPDIELITKQIAGFPSLKLLHAFDDVITGGEFLRNNSIDLLIIELSMPANAAISLVRSLSQQLLIIFTVACKQLTPEVLKLDVLDYLVKPFTLERFARAVNKAMEKHDHAHDIKAPDDSIYIRSTYQLVKIDLTDIEYIEGVENYIKIHRSESKPVMTLMTLKAVLEKLPAGRFIRIHRSYIVPVDKIKYIGNRRVKLSSTELPVSYSYLVNLKGLVKK